MRIVTYQPFGLRRINISSTGTVLLNSSFLSPLKRQRGVSNRCNNATASPSKCANRLPVLLEHSAEQDSSSCSSSVASSSCSSRSSRSARLYRSDACSASSSSSTSLPRPSSSASPSEKRRSRYGREEFSLGHDFLRSAALDSPSPAPTKQKHQSVSLSAFDIVIDITSPTSPVKVSPPLAESSNSTVTTPRSGRPRDLRHMSPPRSRSPTPSLTSMSA